MKNKLLIISIFVILLIALSNATTALDAPMLNVSLVKYEPSPAEPNSYVDVWIKVTNIGEKEAPRAKIVLNPKYPFSVAAGHKSSEDFGIIGVRDEEVVKFRIRVDKDAVQGTNELNYDVTPDYQFGNWVSGKANIDIRTRDATLAITEVITDPEEIAPGSTAKLTIKVQNMADSPLKDVTVKLDFAAVRSVTATLYDLPFAPIGTTSEQKISRINPGDTRLFLFNIMAYPEAEANLYKVPLYVTYADDIGINYTKVDMIGLVVNSEPELAVSVDGIEPNTLGQTGDLILKFVNRGLTDIKFLSVTLGDSDAYEVLDTSKEVYVGNIDSDDYETVDYSIKLKKTGEIEIPLTVQFKDATNKDYEQSTTLRTTVRSAEELGNGTNTTGIAILWIVIIVVVALIVWMVIRKKNKKKKV
ncbi:MAG: hypothetical protein ABIE94_01545 [archaeon]